MYIVQPNRRTKGTSLPVVRYVQNLDKRDKNLQSPADMAIFFSLPQKQAQLLWVSKTHKTIQHGQCKTWLRKHINVIHIQQIQF